MRRNDEISTLLRGELLEIGGRDDMGSIAHAPSLRDDHRVAHTRSLPPRLRTQLRRPCRANRHVRWALRRAVARPEADCSAVSSGASEAGSWRRVTRKVDLRVGGATLVDSA